jgi:hypothetical protein
LESQNNDKERKQYQAPNIVLETWLEKTVGSPVSLPNESEDWMDIP